MYYEKFKMTDIHKYPFVRFVFPLILGIIIELNTNISTDYFLYIIIFLVLIILSLSISKNFSKSFQFRWIYGVFVNITLILLGIYLTDCKTIPPPDKDIFANEASYTAIILETPQEKAKSYKTTVKIESIFDSTSWQIANYNSIIYFQKDSLSAKLKYGDKIILNSKINFVKNAGNPHEFDYAKYLSQKGIHLQGYVSSEKWKFLSENNGDLLTRYAKKSQHYLLDIYRQYNIEGQDFAVVAALTLGYKNDIDPETRDAYAASGAMHILAVSGLHVGIIYMIINLLLSFLNKNKAGKILKAVLIIIILWAFAYISGLSPSVKRSALMFSLITFGSLLNRQASIYNTIAASAFILLLLNPFNINSVGFILSYSAVLSIVYFQPKIYNIFFVKNKLGDKIWALVSVSLAAQLGTMPISFLYFHQFPTYFIITNIVVIPLASIILYFAISLFIVSWIPFIGTIMAFLLKKIVFGLNYSVNLIDSLPYSAIKNIYISPPEVLIFYALIFISGLFFIYKNKKYLQLALGIIIIWISVGIFQNYEFMNTEKLFIYNIRKASAINIINNQKNYLFCDTTIINDPSIIEFSIKNNWLNCGYKNADLHNIDSLQNDTILEFNNFEFKNKFFKYKDKKFLILRDNKLSDFYTNNKLNLDYIILSNNVYIDIADIDLLFNFDKIIFDSSNKYWRINKWEIECKKLGLEFFSVLDSGVFEIDL